MSIKGKTALITGAASGIGLECAKIFLQEGISKCAILDVNLEAGTAVTSELASVYGKDKVVFEKCDISNSAEFETVVKKIITRFGKLDIFINNAGISNEENWESVININLKGTITGIQLGMKYMGKDNGGNGGFIINIASILGLNAAFCWPAYSASKHGVIGYTRAVGTPHYFNKIGVKVVAVCPGPIATQMLKTEYKELPEDMRDSLNKMVGHHGSPQKPIEIAKAVIDVLAKGDNGSIWVSRGGEPVYEVRILDIKEMEKI